MHKRQQSWPEQIALNIDIAPTILFFAGVPIPKRMQGVNLIDLLENKIPERKDFFYQHYFLGGPRIPREEGVVTKDFKYMNYIEHNYEELFDIKHDPHETNNLANDSCYKIKLDELRKFGWATLLNKYKFYFCYFPELILKNYFTFKSENKKFNAYWAVVIFRNRHPANSTVHSQEQRNK